MAQAPNIHHLSPVSVLSCRRSRRGVTPIWGRLARRSKTSRRTSGMGSNSCCCSRSSQVTHLYTTSNRWSQQNIRLSRRFLIKLKCYPINVLKCFTQKPQGKPPSPTRIHTRSCHRALVRFSKLCLSCQSEWKMFSDVKDVQHLCPFQGVVPHNFQPWFDQSHLKKHWGHAAVSVVGVWQRSLEVSCI